MRQRDEHKQEAIIQATIQLINETGFAASSVAKIAKKAEVSPATIYIYYQNKEDLLVSTYVDIKRKISEALLEDFDEKRPLRDIFHKLWVNIFTYISKYPDYFRFSEQFSHSPYEELVDKQAMQAYFEPILAALRKGIEQRIIKDVPFEMLTAFIFYPATNLAKAGLCIDFEADEKDIDTAFTMAWDAIKL